MFLNRNRRVTSKDKYFATLERYLTGEVAAVESATGGQSKYVPVSRVVPTFYRGAIGAWVGK